MCQRMDIPVFNFGATKTHIQGCLVHIVILFIFITIINCQSVTKEHVDNTKSIKLENGKHLDKIKLVKLEKNVKFDNETRQLDNNKNENYTIKFENKKNVDNTNLVSMNNNSSLDKNEFIQTEHKISVNDDDFLKTNTSLDNTKLEGLVNGINSTRDTKPVTALLEKALLGNQAIFDVLNKSKQEQSKSDSVSTALDHVPAINMSLSTWSIAQPSQDNPPFDSQSVPIVGRKLPTPSTSEKLPKTLTAKKNEAIRESDSQSKASLPKSGDVNIPNAGIVIPMAKLLRNKRQVRRLPSQAGAADHQRVLMLLNPTATPRQSAARQRMTFLTNQQSHPLYNITNTTGIGGLGEHSSEPRLTTLIAKRPAAVGSATQPKPAVQSVSDLNLVDLSFPLIARNDQVGPASNASRMTQTSHTQQHGSNTGENDSFHTAVQHRAAGTAAGAGFSNPRQQTRQQTRPTRPSLFQVTQPTPHSNARIVNLRFPSGRQNPSVGTGTSQPAALSTGRRPTPRLTFVAPVSGQRISSLARTPGTATSSRTSSRTSGRTLSGTLPRAAVRTISRTSNRVPGITSRTLGRSPVATSGLSSVRTSGRTMSRTPVGSQGRTAVRAAVRTPVGTLGRASVGTSVGTLGRPSIGSTGRTLGRASMIAAPGGILAGSRVRALVRAQSGTPVRRAGQSQPTTRSRTGARHATPTQQQRQQRTRPARRPSRPDPFTQRFSAGFQRGSHLLHQPPMDFTSFDGTRRDNLGNVVPTDIGGGQPQPPGFMNSMAMPGNIPFPGVGPGMIGGGGGMFLGGPPPFL